MTEVFDWQTIADPRGVLRRVVRALRAGRVVLLPTESEYALAASALRPEAVARLRLDGAAGPLPLVAVRGPGEARDWVPDMAPLPRRLARRVWPGPVTLAFEEGAAQGLLRRLPDEVRRRLCPDSSLRLRAPAHEAILEVLRRLSGPLALAGVGVDQATTDRSLDALVRVVGDRADMLLLDGPRPFPEGATVVRVQGDTWQVERAGAMSEESLREQSACLIVFVCTGNTCRSPMAESLFKKRLADRLGVAVADLASRGYHVVSSGLAAISGGAAAEEAVDAAAAYGADLSQHRSRPLTPELAAQADYLITMTAGHARALVEHLPRLGCRPRLLRADGQDVADPIGQDAAVYRECARQVWEQLGPLAVELVPAKKGESL
jgi:L-threonylcarbamoyladenylate synthase